MTAEANAVMGGDRNAARIETGGDAEPWPAELFACPYQRQARDRLISHRAKAR